MKLYEIALEKIEKRKKLDNKFKNSSRFIVFSIILVSFIFIFGNVFSNILHIPKNIILVISTLVFLVTSFSYWIRNIIKLVRFDKRNDFYLKYRKKEISDFIKLNESGFNEEYIKNQIRRGIISNNIEETIDNIYYLCKTDEFRHQFYWIKNLEKFNINYNKEKEYEIENGEIINQP